MLKDMIEKHTEVIPVSDRINIVDVLTNESAIESMKQDFKELNVISKDINTFTDVMENLRNESGLIRYLASQGYEDITTESATDKAKEIWDKVVKFIKDLITKFKVVYNKLKIKVYAYLNDKDKIIDSLINIAKQINTPLNKDINFYPQERLPYIKDLTSVHGYIEMINIWEKSVGYILLEEAVIYVEKLEEDGRDFEKKEVDDVKVKRIIKFTNGNLKAIYLDNRMQFKLTNIKSLFEYDIRNNKVPTHNEIVNILLNFKTFNKKAKTKFIEKILKSIEDLEKKFSKGKSEYKHSILFSYENAPQNCSTLISASEIIMKDIAEIINDVIYLMSHAIKCYDKEL